MRESASKIPLEALIRILREDDSLGIPICGTTSWSRALFKLTPYGSGAPYRRCASRYAFPISPRAKVEGGPAKVHQEHVAIFEAIRNRDEAAARHAVVDHLSRVAGRLSISLR
jgi:hypothetical protein